MFEGFDATLLARIQFAFTVSFHIIFPAFSIGLASYLAVLNGLFLLKRDSVYLQLFNYWKKIFAVAFGMGVVSGIVMSYQFGTNWSVFSDRTGPVLGPLMAYEVLTAFFLEAGFLGVMLFGREKVGEKLHFFATLMVAVGTLISATWILSVNSWMHTPAGYSINDAGQFIPENWWQIVFNPSFPYRLVHMVLAAYLTTAFIVGGTAAVHLLRNHRHTDSEPDQRAFRKMFSMAMWMAVLVAPLQIFAGDLHGLNTLEHQPAKIAAMEGHYHDWPDGAPLMLFGIPDDENQTLKYAVGIPYLGSIILKHDPFAPIQGLESFPADERPGAEIIFWTFRIMVGIGIAMAGLGLWALFCRWRGKLYTNPWLLRLAVLLSPTGLIAVLAGWITTEVGRQPWVVYGLLKTADARSPIDAPAVGSSLLMFVVVYLLIFGAGTFYLLRLMNSPPKELEQDVLNDGPLRSAGITPRQQTEDTP